MVGVTRRSEFSSADLAEPWLRGRAAATNRPELARSHARTRVRSYDVGELTPTSASLRAMIDQLDNAATAADNSPGSDLFLAAALEHTASGRLAKAAHVQTIIDRATRTVPPVIA